LSTVEEIVKMSKGGSVEYDTIEYRGVKLLITISKIKPLVGPTGRTSAVKRFVRSSSAKAGRRTGTKTQEIKVMEVLWLI